MPHGVFERQNSPVELRSIVSHDSSESDGRLGSTFSLTDNIITFISKTEYEEKERRIQGLRVSAERHLEILDRLILWHEWDQNRRRSFRAFLLSGLMFTRRPQCPDISELVDLAHHYFPPCSSIKAEVCDIGHGYFKHHEGVNVGNLANCFFFPNWYNCLEPLTDCWQIFKRNPQTQLFVGCKLINQ